MDDSILGLGLLGFKNKKERNDAFIALLVLLLFGWAIYHFGGFCKTDLPMQVPAIAPIANLDDKDKDGIADVNDNCPELAGIKENNGCPMDTDGDSVYDINDDCPNVAGSIEAKGCPLDSDDDGIYDRDDECPEQFGIAEKNGCPEGPDADKDGIIDENDDCPEVKGSRKTKGCPDADKDGIRDDLDECKDVAGIAKYNGCPDTDGDGIIDKNDDCPNVAGKVKGCPDSDGDGILDKNDDCPNEKGTERDKGCPIPDKDGDGVDDRRDKCPNVAGTRANNGCPEMKAEEKAVFAGALEGIEFQSNKDILIGDSKKILQNVANIMKKYPDMKLNITGHTDSTGDDAANLQLSRNRAIACKNYLKTLGIPHNKMTAEGKGETKPIGDNATLEGRKKNRRVEFKPVN